MFHLIHRNKHHKSNKMRTQRNKFQAKEQNKTWGKYKKPSEIEINNLFDKQLKGMITRMFTKFGRMEELSENFNKD